VIQDTCTYGGHFHQQIAQTTVVEAGGDTGVHVHQSIFNLLERLIKN